MLQGSLELLQEVVKHIADGVDRADRYFFFHSTVIIDLNQSHLIGDGQALFCYNYLNQSRMLKGVGFSTQKISSRLIVDQFQQMKRMQKEEQTVCRSCQQRVPRRLISLHRNVCVVAESASFVVNAEDRVEMGSQGSNRRKTSQQKLTVKNKKNVKRSESDLHMRKSKINGTELNNGNVATEKMENPKRRLNASLKKHERKTSMASRVDESSLSRTRYRKGEIKLHNSIIKRKQKQIISIKPEFEKIYKKGVAKDGLKKQMVSSKYYGGEVDYDEGRAKCEKKNDELLRIQRKKQIQNQKLRKIEKQRKQLRDQQRQLMKEMENQRKQERQIERRQKEEKEERERKRQREQDRQRQKERQRQRKEREERERYCAQEKRQKRQRNEQMRNTRNGQPRNRQEANRVRNSRHRRPAEEAYEQSTRNNFNYISQTINQQFQMMREQFEHMNEIFSNFMPYFSGNGIVYFDREDSSFEDSDDEDQFYEQEEQHEQGGLTLEEVEMMPKHPYQKKIGNDDQCTVCLSSLKHGQIVRRLPCQHIFHVDCIDEWLSRKAACPVCRQNLSDHFT